MKLNKLTTEYTKNELALQDLSSNPIDQFEKWMQSAIDFPLENANAMTLSTSDKNHKVTSRIVLLKTYDKNGFVFFTNYNSSKAKAIKYNNQVSLSFAYLPQERQIIITGKAIKIPTPQSLKYFLSRPRGARIGAWSSQQSQVISSRSVLLSQVEKIKNKFANKEIPLPDFWGGFRVVPYEIEFWQGRKNRLHDRFIYKFKNKEWQCKRKSP
ncbi:MAG: pyridoxamine 5'-phosphate oxidase [Gammaproteobacteria bacterium]|nr:MAG: pyridoxamine 5'-phosphate oxidase [Gammaproteobacteria bacterium]